MLPTGPRARRSPAADRSRFWQVFLWGWGGFLLEDRLEQEHALLAAQTGIPEPDVPMALAAFDMFFPVKGAKATWYRNPGGDSRKVLVLMPAAVRGIGAYLRQAMYGVEDYSELGFKDLTGNRLALDHNTAVRLLDDPKKDLVK